MTLLDIYLGAVGMNLPKGSDKPDILAELRGHLEANMDERAAELGRPLNETEQQAVLVEFGDPFTVATRYGRKAGRGIAFGPLQLISPEAFPVYVGVMLFVLTINVLVALVEIVLTGMSFATLVRERAVNILILLIVLTLAFAGVDFFLRRSRKRQRGAPETWLFWTPHLKYVPAWYSASGLALLSVIALAWGLWWNAWPAVPALLLGEAVNMLELSPEWQRCQLFLLGLLLLGAGQRAFSLVRPKLTSVPWVVRLAINVLCVALLYPILVNGPLVVVRDAVTASADAVELARSIDHSTRGLLRGFGVYWVLNALWIGLICAWHVGHGVGQRRRSTR